ncbi:1-aminocyclopropane-1-carboxylate deaminase/D-cysteine desulfhydrase-like pyridoxal-dependent ACC family enzyme [Pontibacter ummariensis]|uniref:1-aminocyclopropane-1-carboxylate deaminase/D-cysteine desulfhydrase, PLP-dependent ACC family n=1 Tax=Pontibacter ummariensis TaxID=1610492 RepID=A0A239K9Y4_9BACT|nr:pyridoxal-phosphate dependent enzyme [Pontibacter ummariensis]PRY06049.1 1-aminocyclopropane-1-carboxylate deaminase/D-cysteine desulfhydrase-like pyridoxal-dependent ACC family enzyme [Pontibacter ummariensis]SNT14502.1 1-aminocyclopropane-1-carboxylate deaminase/D-cysteine desulfhydrase, PLP-dependent ACC family [Pontibacter ummariensis]
MEAPLQRIQDTLLQEHSVTLWIKREDLLHPHISGNKWRKLKYNLQEAKHLQKDTLLTFGGAYSNHIAATAAAGKEFGFKTVGLIRGEEHLPLNPTLHFATSCGMELRYLNREQYRHKQDPAFSKRLSAQFGEPYMLPEGGTNSLAVKGCTEIVTDVAVDYDYICCASGTGGTLAGIVAGLDGEKQVLGFPALKGGAFLQEETAQLIISYNGKQYNNWQLITDYHFGGYAKVKPELLEFMQQFQKQHGIPLEPVYTGKMLFGLYDLIRRGYFPPNSNVIAVHTGGLQGNAGFKERLGVEV